MHVAEVIEVLGGEFDLELHKEIRKCKDGGEVCKENMRRISMRVCY